MKRIILALIPALIAAVGTPATQSNLARDARAADNQPISNT